MIFPNNQPKFGTFGYPFYWWSGQHGGAPAAIPMFPGRLWPVLCFGHSVVQWGGLAKFGAQAIVLTIREAVVAWLRSFTPLTALIGPRIYFENPSELSVYPCVVVKVDNRTYGHNLAGADGHSVANFTIEAISQFESMSVACARAIRSGMDGFRGLQSGVAILTCLLQDESDASTPPLAGSNQWIYHVATEYRIKHRVPFPTVTQTNV